MKFRALPTITITWKNHENGSHTNKNSTRYRSWHTLVRGETYLYDILITRIWGGSHSSVCYYLSQPAKQAVFIIVPIYCSIQFTFEMPICFSQRCLKWRLYIATRRVLGRLWHSNTLNRNLKEERRKNKRFVICENSYIYILYII